MSGEEKETEKKKPVLKILGLVFVILLGILAGSYSWFKVSIYDKSHYAGHSSVSAAGISDTERSDSLKAGDAETEIETEAETLSALEQLAEKAFDSKDTYNLLLLGVDRRDESWEGNSDVVLLLTVNNQKKTVYLTSFLRDLYADIPGIRVHKLNAACANGGPELTVRSLKETYQVQIDNYAMVDFNAMIHVIDVLGGVDLEIDEDERVTANDYITCMAQDNNEDPEQYYIEEAGFVHLNGYQAVGYARNRYTGKGSDFGRTQRQRNVLNAIFDKARGEDLNVVLQAVEGIMPYITHDISSFKMIGLMLQIPKWEDYKIEEQHIPYDDEYYVDDEVLMPTDMIETIEKLNSTIYG